MKTRLIDFVGLSEEGKLSCTQCKMYQKYEHEMDNKSMCPVLHRYSQYDGFCFGVDLARAGKDRITQLLLGLNIGASMYPTLKHGDFLVIDPSVEVTEGDIVVMLDGSDHIVKRISKTFVKSGQTWYFILGDNRLNSRDSRDYGLVNKERLVGKVIHYFSPSSTFMNKEGINEGQEGLIHD